MLNNTTKKLTKSVAVGAFVLASLPQAMAGYLTNFNDPNSQNLAAAIAGKNLHVVQLGDSHTAADVMTDALRDTLQGSLGNGGLGWGIPTTTTGNRMANFSYSQNGWSSVSIRTSRTGNYTIGGIIATPKNGGTIRVSNKNPAPPQRVIFSIRQSAADGAMSVTDATGKTHALSANQKNNHWQLVAMNLTLPFTVNANSATGSALGGFWSFNQQGGGAVVSPLGINGAQLSYMNKFSNDWLNELGSIAPNLVILAYGTNEAYNDGMSAATIKNTFTQKVQEIRRASPRSAIMIVNAPESLKNKSGNCGTRPIQLDTLQGILRDVASTQHTLYWDWQGMMGGRCTMKTWISRGDAAKDGVHFTTSGYRKIGSAMANDILALRSASSVGAPAPTDTYIPSSAPTSGRVFISPSQPANPTGKICSSDGKTCRGI